MAQGPFQVTPAEFEILEILWAADSAQSVGDVLETLQKRKSVAYTTVMTLLDKMARKGSVRRRKKGKAYLYLPATDRKQVLSHVVDTFAGSYFDGKRRRLASFLDNAPPQPGSRENRRRQRSPRTVAQPESEGAKGGKLSEEMDVVLL